MVWTGSQLVAAGDSGTVAISPDGRIWTKRSSGVTDRFRSLAWTGSLVVALVNGTDVSTSSIVTSPDGIVWTTSPQTFQLLTSITWTGGQLVAVGMFGSVVSSPEGIDWTNEYSESNDWNWLYAVTWANNQLVAVGEKGTVFTSPQVPNHTVSGHVEPNGTLSVRQTGASLVATLPNSLFGRDLRATIYDISGTRVVDRDVEAIGRAISVPIQGVANGLHILEIKSPYHRISRPIYMGRPFKETR